MDAQLPKRGSICDASTADGRVIVYAARRATSEKGVITVSKNARVCPSNQIPYAFY